MKFLVKIDKESIIFRMNIAVLAIAYREIFQ